MRVFVYGTLRKQDSRFGVLEGCECVAEEAYLDGFDMLHLGGFPGIVSGEGRVRGEIYEIDDQILKRLDQIEGYREDDPKHSLYIRESVDAFFDDGNSVPVNYLGIYTYVFNIERRERADFEIIESGDWFEARPPREHTSASS